MGNASPPRPGAGSMVSTTVAEQLVELDVETVKRVEIFWQGWPSESMGTYLGPDPRFPGYPTIYGPCGGNVYAVHEPGAARTANPRRWPTVAVRTMAVYPPDRERRKARPGPMQPCGKGGNGGVNSRWRPVAHDARARTGRLMRADHFESTATRRA